MDWYDLDIGRDALLNGHHCRLEPSGSVALGMFPLSYDISTSSIELQSYVH